VLQLFEIERARQRILTRVCQLPVCQVPKQPQLSPLGREAPVYLRANTEPILQINPHQELGQVQGGLLAHSRVPALADVQRQRGAVRARGCSQFQHHRLVLNIVDPGLDTIHQLAQRPRAQAVPQFQA